MTTDEIIQFIKEDNNDKVNLVVCLDGTNILKDVNLMNLSR